MQENKLFKTRPYKEADKNFIYASWLRGLFYGDTWFRDIDKDRFMRGYHKVLDSIMSRPGTVVSVACLDDDEDVILGYAVSRKVSTDHVLDWVFVKTAWRKIGIARSLVPSGITVVTHLTKTGKSALSKFPKSPIFDPFLVWTQTAQGGTMSDKKHRPLEEIQNQYAELSFKAGTLQYQVFTLGKDLGLINDQMRDLNFEAAAALAAEPAVSEEAPVSNE